jgi:hypothetical protein
LGLRWMFLAEKHSNRNAKLNLCDFDFGKGRLYAPNENKISDGYRARAPARSGSVLIIEKHDRVVWLGHGY